MILVADTGPLIGLAKIRKIRLLEAVRERGYWLSDDIVATAQRMAGELPGSE